MSSPNPPATDRHREAAKEIYERFIELKAFDPDKDDRILNLLLKHFPIGEKPR